MRPIGGIQQSSAQYVCEGRKFGQEYIEKLDKCGM
jgi:hypothetical protein